MTAYLDHAATGPVRPEVLDAMLPFLRDAWGNPASAHARGRAARVALEQARRELAQAIGAAPSQVVFTSGGTEADNLAVTGAALAARARGESPRVLVGATEHKAVLEAAEALGRLGARHEVIPVDRDGVIDLPQLDVELARGAALASVMWVNNETGTVQPVADIAERCRAARVPCHTDAVQAVGKLPVDLAALPPLLLTVSGHKLGAPKGTGALVVPRRGLLEPLLHGGGQQFGLRPGTESVAQAVALARAVHLAVRERGQAAARMARLRDRLEAGVRAVVPDVVLHGAGAERAPHVVSVAVPGCDAAVLLMHLDLLGVAASGGSACSTGASTPSHVLLAMGVPPALARATVRLSVAADTTDAEVAHALAVLPEAVGRARQLAGALADA